MRPQHPGVEAQPGGPLQDGVDVVGETGLGRHQLEGLLGDLVGPVDARRPVHAAARPDREDDRLLEPVLQLPVQVVGSLVPRHRPDVDAVHGHPRGRTVLEVEGGGDVGTPEHGERHEQAQQHRSPLTPAGRLLLQPGAVVAHRAGGPSVWSCGANSWGGQRSSPSPPR
ncbi:hypothetical protein [Ornithinimicrobium kibberense]|uniref:hypothetical protein n=1 Tax=Ornithinimicrobium kibberense TaxID=282060 RepID=UPI00361C9800